MSPSIGIGLSPVIGGGPVIGGAPAFVPNQISDLVCWYEAGQGITLNGSDVALWADLSGEGNSLSQASPVNQPLFNPADANFNGQPSIGFNGSTDFLSTALFASPLSQPNSIILVMKRASTGVDTIVFDGLQASNRNIFLNQDTGTSEAMFGGSAVIKGGTSDTSIHEMACLFNTTSSSLYRDGGTPIAAGSIGSNTLTGLALAVDYQANGHGHFDIAALYIFNKLLSSSELNLLGNYNAKYGITRTDI